MIGSELPRSTNIARLVALVLGLALLSPSEASAYNLVSNPSLETAHATMWTLPKDWELNHWGDVVAFFTYLGSGYTGVRSILVERFSGTYGDAKWWSSPITLALGGGYYQVSNYYRATATGELMVLAEGQNGGQAYFTVALTPAASAWTLVQGIVYLPIGTQKIRVMHVIRSNGWIQTDDYTVEKLSAPAADAGTLPDAPKSPDSAAKDGGTLDVTLPVMPDMSMKTDSQASSKDGSTPWTPGQAVASVAFDDGWVSAYKEAVPILSSAGLRATHFIHAEWVDKVGYTADHMTSTQLLDLASKGHEIGSHALNDSWKTEAGDSTKMVKQLADSKSLLEKLGLSVVGFAPPNGYYTSAIKTEVMARYKYMRTINSGLNLTGQDPFELKCVVVTNLTTLSEVGQWISLAKLQNAWLVLLYHRLEKNATADTMVTPTRFKEDMNLLKQSGIPVLPIGEVLGVWKPKLTASDGGLVTADSGAKPEAGTLVDAGPWPDGGGTVLPGTDLGLGKGDKGFSPDLGTSSLPRPLIAEDRGCAMAPEAGSPGILGLVLALLLLLRRNRRSRT